MNTIPTRRAQEILKLLGVKDAASRGQSHQRFPAIHQHLLLTAFWRMVVDENERWTKAPQPAIKRLLAKGIDPVDLTDVVREMQIDLLYDVCQLLDHSGHGIEDLQAKIAENVEWRVCEYDGEREEVGRPMHGLHESFHSADPSGRDGELPQRGQKTPRKPAKRP